MSNLLPWESFQVMVCVGRVGQDVRSTKNPTDSLELRWQSWRFKTARMCKMKHWNGKAGLGWWAEDSLEYLAEPREMCKEMVLVQEKNHLNRLEGQWPVRQHECETSFQTFKKMEILIIYLPEHLQLCYRSPSG